RRVALAALPALEPPLRRRLPAAGERTELSVLADPPPRASAAARLCHDRRGGDEAADRTDVHVPAVQAALRGRADRLRRDLLRLLPLPQLLAALPVGDRRRLAARRDARDGAARRAADLRALCLRGGGVGGDALRRASGDRRARNTPR